MRPRVLVRVVETHTPGLDYHQWVTLGERFRGNRLGIHNPRIYFPEWTKWVCNNGSCRAWAVVHDDAVRALLESGDGFAWGAYREHRDRA